MFVAYQGATLLISITHVISKRPKPEMRRITTGWVITLVANAEFTRVNPMSDEVGYPGG
jgi:hypothetical protein